MRYVPILAAWIIWLHSGPARASATVIRDIRLDPALVQRQANSTPAKIILILDRQQVRTTIRELIAETVLTQVFRNRGARPAEVDYQLRVPKDACLTRLYLWMNGKKTRAEILGPTDAAHVYRRIVARIKDPALVERIDERTYRVRVFPVPAGGTQKIEIRYLEILSCREGEVTYRLPLAEQKGIVAQAAKRTTVSVHLESATSIEDIRSGTHRVEVDHRPPQVKLDLSDDPSPAARDFVLHYRLRGGSGRMHLWTYRAPEEDGYFLALVPITGRVQRLLAKSDLHFGILHGEAYDLFTSIADGPKNDRRILVTGRYAIPRSAEVRLAGRTAEGSVPMTSQHILPGTSKDHAFVPAFWTRARISSLTDARPESRKPSKPNLEIFRLARKHPLVTTHTSLLAHGLKRPLYTPEMLKAKAPARPPQATADNKPEKEKIVERTDIKKRSQVKLDAKADQPFFTPEKLEVTDAQVETENEAPSERLTRGQQDALSTIPAGGSGAIGFFGAGGGGRQGAFGWITGGGGRRSSGFTLRLR